MSSFAAHRGFLQLMGATVVLVGALCSCATPSPIAVSFPQGGAPSVTYPDGKSRALPQQVAGTGQTKSPNTTAGLPVQVKVVQFVIPREPASSAPQKKATTNGAREEVAQANSELVVHPTREDYQGGAVVYNYVRNQVYELFTAPYELTDIALEPGETLTSSPASGDTADFILATSYSRNGAERIEHVLLKPVYSGKQTTLLITTDKRSYTFSVYSFQRTHMPLVSFRYPFEQARLVAQAQRAQEVRIPTYGTITNLDFNYRIIPHTLDLPAWAPSHVFNDGRRTYIDFPSADRAAYAPVLFSVDAHGARTIVNYHLQGTYYIVDSVLSHAELVLSANDGNVITILRTGR